MAYLQHTDRTPNRTRPWRFWFHHLQQPIFPRRLPREPENVFKLNYGYNRTGSIFLFLKCNLGFCLIGQKSMLFTFDLVF